MEVKSNVVSACAGEVERMPMPNAVEAPSTTEAKFQVVMSKESSILTIPFAWVFVNPYRLFLRFPRSGVQEATASWSEIRGASLSALVRAPFLSLAD
jgi:hypothetical protein